ncbi:ABC transporter permease [Candidatus Planktophila versatilis]|uniref:Ribose transport system permease protein n=1 Tax=Candidatus Planktophila versatilis TaxID=1884905 RepID=A0ABM6MDM6_9ACTN|nr:ABC transporter permease [Candidatus Planktophila versatilis]ASY17012.1 ribose transport system permease protein [Candidatus Planktophila versatilis]
MNTAALNRFEKSPKILRSIKKFLGPTGFGLLVALILELIIFASLSPYFFSSTNFSNIGRAMVIIGIGSIGATIVIISGGFDLSVGSVMAASGMLAAFVINQGQSNLVGVVLALMLGCVIGLLNGFVIGYLRINPLIATLAMLSIVRGLAYIISGGDAVIVSNSSFLAIGTDSLFGVPLTVWIFVTLFLSVGFLMPRTHFGRYVYAIGSNSRAARLAGIFVNRWTLVFYAFSGTTAALAGYVTVARTGQAEPSANIGAELDMITAVILGGASLSGGKGRLVGTFLAIVVLAILANGLILIGVPSYWQLPVKGCVLMGAIIWGELHNSSRDKS